MSNFTQNYNTGPETAAEIIMLRAAADRTALIVEGPSDYKFFFPLVSEEQCDIIIAWNKENCLEAIRILNSKSIIGVLAVIDKDYDEFLDVNIELDNAITADSHDLESIIFQSSALEKVLIEIGSQEKVKNYRKDVGDLREAILSVAHPIGVARLTSLKFGLNLKFEGLRFRSISKNLQFNLVELFKEICNHSQRLDIPVELLTDQVEKWQNTEHNRWLMCCGHDICRVFGIGLQALWGTRNATEVTLSEIESKLRLAFDKEHFENTDIYVKIRRWEADNQPYIVLRP